MTIRFVRDEDQLLWQYVSRAWWGPTPRFSIFEGLNNLDQQRQESARRNALLLLNFDIEAGQRQQLSHCFPMKKSSLNQTSYSQESLQFLRYSVYCESLLSILLIQIQQVCFTANSGTSVRCRISQSTPDYNTLNKEKRVLLILILFRILVCTC